MLRVQTIVTLVYSAESNIKNNLGIYDLLHVGLPARGWHCGPGSVLERQLGTVPTRAR